LLCTIPDKSISELRWHVVAFQAAVYKAIATAKVPASNFHDCWYNLAYPTDCANIPS